MELSKTRRTPRRDGGLNDNTITATKRPSHDSGLQAARDALDEHRDTTALQPSLFDDPKREIRAALAVIDHALDGLEVPRRGRRPARGAPRIARCRECGAIEADCLCGDAPASAEVARSFIDEARGLIGAAS